MLGLIALLLVGLFVYLLVAGGCRGGAPSTEQPIDDLWKDDNDPSPDALGLEDAP